MNTVLSLQLLMDDCALYERNESGKKQLNISELAGNLAYHAMMLEVHLTPKPGLVDTQSNGAHKDMNIDTFVASSNTLRPFMKRFVAIGSDFAHLPAEALLPRLRKVGVEAENAMFQVTKGVNTHKGMIFTLGLICGAVGWLHQNSRSYNSLSVRDVISRCCHGLVEKDLGTLDRKPITAGEKIYQQTGNAGIRSEAANGYPTIFAYGLPAYQKSIAQGHSEEHSMSHALTSIMAHNFDTNLINRGGIEGLQLVQLESSAILETAVLEQESLSQNLWRMDELLIKKNLSPGGSADLLAATWLLAQLDVCSNKV